MKFHDGQYQFKFRFILYADIESILKPVDEQYNEKMNQIKTEREGKTPYTKKMNTHVPSGCVYTRLFAYGDTPDLSKIYRGKDWVKMFVEPIEDEVAFV